MRAFKKTRVYGLQFESQTLRIPFCKQKFAKANATFFVLNSGRTYAALVSCQTLLKGPVAQVKNKMVPMGDYFYELALENVEFVNLLAKTIYSRERIIDAKLQFLK